MVFEDFSDLKQAVGQRHSVRTFAGRPLNDEQTVMLEKVLTHTVSPFGGRVAMRLADVGGIDEFRPSTYGVIRRARSYMLLGYNPADRDAALSAGYLGETAVLAAAGAGLGTCWIAGTFRADTFSPAASFDAETPLQIVIPAGEAASRRSMVDSLMHAVAGSGRRKPMSQLFFDGAPDIPLREESIYYKPLELMRLAPSAVNIQPWRAIVDGQDDRVYFYASTLKHHGWVNMGIGLCHFELACNALGVKGKLVATDAMPPVKDWIAVAEFVADMS